MGRDEAPPCVGEPFMGESRRRGSSGAAGGGQPGRVGEKVLQTFGQRGGADLLAEPTVFAMRDQLGERSDRERHRWEARTLGFHTHEWQAFTHFWSGWTAVNAGPGEQGPEVVA